MSAAESKPEAGSKPEAKLPRLRLSAAASLNGIGDAALTGRLAEPAQ